MDPSYDYIMSQLCSRLEALGQSRQINIRERLQQSPTTDTFEDILGDPDFYEVNWVPLPHIAPSNEVQLSGVPEFETTFVCPPRVINEKTVNPSGPSMLECLLGTSDMLDGETRLDNKWGDNIAGTINVPITWPGYHAHLVAEISVFEETETGKQRITRAELAKRIAMYYIMFFDSLTTNEDLAHNGLPANQDAVGDDNEWKVGLRGYLFDRLNIMSVTQTFGNFCKLEIAVLTAKGFPHSTMYP